MSKPFTLCVYYDDVKQTVTISDVENIVSESKVYNKIRTPGDVGTAVKDYTIAIVNGQE